MTGKTDDLWLYKDILTANGAIERNAFQRAAAGKGNVCLSTSKDASREVYLYIIKGEALAFVNGNGPG